MGGFLPQLSRMRRISTRGDLIFDVSLGAFADAGGLNPLTRHKFHLPSMKTSPITGRLDAVSRTSIFEERLYFLSKPTMPLRSPRISLPTTGICPPESPGLSCTSVWDLLITHDESAFFIDESSLFFVSQKRLLPSDTVGLSINAFRELPSFLTKLVVKEERHDDKMRSKTWFLFRIAISINVI